VECRTLSVTLPRIPRANADSLRVDIAIKSASSFFASADMVSAGVPSIAITPTARPVARKVSDSVLSSTLRFSANSAITSVGASVENGPIAVDSTIRNSSVSITDRRVISALFARASPAAHRTMVRDSSEPSIGTQIFLNITFSFLASGVTRQP
jgi:hypothetical protein